MRASQAGVLCVNPRQVGLPKRQVHEVQTAQVSASQPQQVHHIARPIALLRVGPIAPAVKQRQQPPLRSAMATFCVQSLEDGFADQTLLRLPHVVFGLRPDKWLVD